LLIEGSCFRAWRGEPLARAAGKLGKLVPAASAVAALGWTADAS